VSSEEWAALKETVTKSYENVLLCIAGTDGWSEDQVGMAIGMVAHTAYHLGAIRQLAKDL
jgi:DNA/RNA-binding domain of Phe-tRNA-synthetase-like protein